MSKWMARAVKTAVWANSRQGRHDIGAALGALTAIYTALHGVGVI